MGRNAWPNDLRANSWFCLAYFLNKPTQTFLWFRHGFRQWGVQCARSIDWWNLTFMQEMDDACAGDFRWNRRTGQPFLSESGIHGHAIGITKWGIDSFVYQNDLVYPAYRKKITGVYYRNGLDFRIKFPTRLKSVITLRHLPIIGMTPKWSAVTPFVLRARLRSVLAIYFS